jgi:hypothetical protein
MAEQTIEELIQSVTRAVSRANRVLQSEQENRYGVSELEISTPISQLSVADEVLVDTGRAEDAEGREGYLRFTVAPIPREETETLPTEDLPELEDQPVARSLQVLLDRGFKSEQVQLAFNPAADAKAGEVVSYRIQEARGIRPPEIVLTVAGEPPEEGTVGDVVAQTPSSVSGSPVGEYRRREDSDTWHFCRNCSNYPREAYEASAEKPSSGEFCNECQSKKESGQCQ